MENNSKEPDLELSVLQIEKNIQTLQEDVNNCLAQTFGLGKGTQNAILGEDEPYLYDKIRVFSLDPEKLIATDDIHPGTLLFADKPKIIYSNFLITSLEDYTYKTIDVRAGIVPKYWTCISCMMSVGGVIPNWCCRCGLPICVKCDKDRKHKIEDPICSFTYDNNLKFPNRRFLNLGDIYIDVAITRFLLREQNDESFKSEVKRQEKDIRITKILASQDLSDKFTSKKFPLAFTAANIGYKNIVLRAYAFLTAFGNGFYPRSEFGIFHPILGMFSPSCYPNTETEFITDIGILEIRSTCLISKGNFLFLDFIQEVLLPTVYRQNLIRSRWYMNCTCVRCSDSTEFQTFIGSIRCPKCQNGYLSPKFNFNLNLNQITSKLVEKIDLDLIYICINPSNLQHNCQHECFFSSIKQRDDMSMKTIKQITQKLSSYDRCNEYQKFKQILKVGLHDNYFLVQLLNRNLTSLSKQFLTMEIDSSITLEFHEISKRKKTEGNTIYVLREKLSAYDQLIPLVRRLSPDLSKYIGHIYCHRAKLEESLMNISKEEEKISKFDSSIYYILNVVPHFLEAWKHLLQYKSQGQMYLIHKIAGKFFKYSLQDQFQNLKHIQQKNNLAEQITEEIIISKPETIKEGKNRTEAAEELLRSVTAAAAAHQEIERSPRRYYIEEEHHEYPPKEKRNNKLKEALIRQEGVEGFLRLESKKKEFRLDDLDLSEGGRLKRKEKCIGRRSRSLGTGSLDDEEEELWREEEESISAPETTHSNQIQFMENPIPIHKGRGSRKNRFLYKSNLDNYKSKTKRYSNNRLSSGYGSNTTDQQIDEDPTSLIRSDPPTTSTTWRNSYQPNRQRYIPKQNSQFSQSTSGQPQPPSNHNRIFSSGLKYLVGSPPHEHNNNNTSTYPPPPGFNQLPEPEGHVTQNDPEITNWNFAHHQFYSYVHHQLPPNQHHLSLFFHNPNLSYFQQYQ